MIRGQSVLDAGNDEVVPEGGLDLRKPSSTTVGTKGKLCSWCGKRNISSPNGLAGSSSWSYCSERCYELFRRAVFKKRSACLWCSNSGSGGRLSTVVNVHSNLDETKFCSECCLTQFKLKLFCEETTSHLHQIKEKETTGIGGNGKDLITPALWLPKDAPPLLSDPSPSTMTPCTRIRDGRSDRVFGFTFQPTWRDRHGPVESPSDTSSANTVTSSAAIQGKKEASPPLVPIPLSTHGPTRALQTVKRPRRGHSPLGNKTPFPTTLSSRSRSPRPFISPAISQVGGTHSRYESPTSSTTGQGRQLRPHLTILPTFDQSQVSRPTPIQTERISIVPVPFPFLFPVLLPSTHTSKVLDPIEDLE